MTLAKIPITGGAYKNVDEVSLTNNSVTLIDGYVDEIGNTVKRPGLEFFKLIDSDASNVDGTYWWEKQKSLVVVCNKKTYLISDKTGTSQEITGDAFVSTGTPIIFSDNGDELFMANGGRIMCYSSSARLSSPVFKGSGNDDLTPSGIPVAAKSFRVEIESAGDKASGSIMFIGRNNVVDGDEIVVDTITYTFKDIMAQAYDVKIGAELRDSLSNLDKAVNASGTEGVEYFTGTMGNPSFVSSLISFTLYLTSITYGSIYNEKALTTDVSPNNYIVHFSGGTDQGELKHATGSLNLTGNIIDGDTVVIGETTYRFKTTLSQVYDVLLPTTPTRAVNYNTGPKLSGLGKLFTGNTVSYPDITASNRVSALFYLAMAINGSDDSGSFVYTGTVAHPDVAASGPDSNSVVTITASLAGESKNGIATTTTSAGLEWTATVTSGGTSNKFKWSSNGGSTWEDIGITITKSSQSLSDGISITIASNIGHNAGDYWDFYTTQNSTFLLPNLNAPDKVTHVAVTDQYLLCNLTGTGEAHYSEVGNLFIFNPLNFITAEIKPDDVVAIHVGWRNIILVGTETTEVWYDDGVTPFSRIDGSFIERGCIAPYSIQFANNTWMWLDHQRRFIMLEGTTPKIISTPFDKIIQSFSSVSDAISTIIQVDGRNFYCISFPAVNKTLVYEYDIKQWSEWGKWDNLSASYNRFSGFCSAYSPAWGIHFIGDRSSGNLFTMNGTVFQDNGSILRTVRRTGHVDHGTSKIKRSNELLVKARRGAGGVSGDNPQIMIRWRDNNGDWGTEITMSLGQIGENEFIGKQYRLGMYRTRQWEFSHTDNSPFVLVSADEDIEVMTR